MKTILSMVLVLGGLVVCGLTATADDKKAADPVGTWKCDYEVNGMKRTSELTIKKDGDNLVGTMNWPDQKDEKLKDVKFADDTLTCSAVRKVMGMELNITYKLKITEDTLKGKGTVDAGGQKREFDIEAKREKK